MGKTLERGAAMARAIKYAAKAKKDSSPENIVTHTVWTPERVAAAIVEAKETVRMLEDASLALSALRYMKPL